MSREILQRLGRHLLRLKPDERHLSRRSIRRSHDLHVRHLPHHREVFSKSPILQVFRHILHAQPTRRRRRVVSVSIVTTTVRARVSNLHRRSGLARASSAVHVETREPRARATRGGVRRRAVTHRRSTGRSPRRSIGRSVGRRVGRFSVVGLFSRGVRAWRRARGCDES